MNVTILLSLSTSSGPTLGWLLFLLVALFPGRRSKENLEFSTLKSTPGERNTQKPGCGAEAEKIRVLMPPDFDFTS